MSLHDEMLAALKACRDTLRAQMADNWHEDEWPETVFFDAYQQALAAIARAEGTKQ